MTLAESMPTIVRASLGMFFRAGGEERNAPERRVAREVSDSAVSTDASCET